MRIAAVVLGALALAGTILLVIAGASSGHSNAMGPLAFLLCIFAVALMIFLGVAFGGRGRQTAAPETSVPETAVPDNSAETAPPASGEVH
jgi:hypothetical protein